MAVLGTLTVELMAKAQRFIAGMNKAQQSARTASEELKRVSAAASKIAVAMGAVGGVTAKITADFEKSMVRAAAIAGKGASGFNKSFSSMEASAIQLSKTTEFTAQQVSEGMTFMAMAGSDAKTSIASMPAVLQLASAAALDLGRSADIVTNVMKGFDIGTSELAKTNNVLIGTFTNSNTSLEQLGRSFRKTGPTAKALGISIEDTATVIGTMGNAGFQAEEAGTALRNVMIRLIKATPAAEKAMTRLGITTKTLSEKGLLGTVEKLKETKGAFDRAGMSAEFSADLMEVFGLRAGPVLQAALNQSTEDVNKLRAAIDNAVANNTAEFIERKQLETLTGQFNILRSNIEAAAISFGQPLAKSLQKVLKFLQEVFAAAANLSSEFKSFAVGAGLFTFALSSAVAVSTAFLAIIPAVIAGVVAMNAALVTAGVTLTGVLLPAFAVVAAGVGGFVLMLNLLEETTGKTFNVMDTISDVFVTISERADGVSTVMRSLVGAIAATAQQLIPLTLIDVTGWFEGWASSASDANSEMQNLTENTRDFLKNDDDISALIDKMEGLGASMAKRGERKDLGAFQGNDVRSFVAKDNATDLELKQIRKLNVELANLFRKRAAFDAAERRRRKSTVEDKKEATLAEEAAKVAAEEKADAEMKAAKALELQLKLQKELEATAKRRAKALRSAVEAMKREIFLHDTPKVEAEIFDMATMKREFPELGALIGERAKQIIEGVKLDDLAGALEAAVGAGVINSNVAQQIANKRVSKDNSGGKALASSFMINDIVNAFRNTGAAMDEISEKGAFLASNVSHLEAVFGKMRNQAALFAANVLGRLADGDLVGAVGDVLAEVLIPAGEKIGSKLAKAFNISKGVGSEIGGMAAGFVVGAFQKAADMMIEFTKQMFSNVASAASGIADDIGAGGAFSPLQKGLTSLQGALSSAVLAVFALGTAIVAVLAFPITIPMGLAVAALTLLAAALTVVTGGLPILAGAFSFLAGFAFNMAQQTEEGAELQGAFNNAIKDAAAPLAPFAHQLFALVPILNMVMTGISELAAMFLGGLPRLLFESFKLLGLGALQVAVAVESLRIEFNEHTARMKATFLGIQVAWAGVEVWLAKMQLFLQTFLKQDTTFQEQAVKNTEANEAALRGELEKLVSTFGDTSGTMERLQSIIGVLAGTSFPDAIKAGRGFAEAAADASAAFGESMTNDAQGFKVALERFRAIDPAAGSPSPGAVGDVASTGGGNFNVGVVNVFADDTRTLIDELSNAAAQTTQEQTGGLSAEQLRSGGSF